MSHLPESSATGMATSQSGQGTRNQITIPPETGSPTRVDSVREVRACRSCGSRALDAVLNLGEHYVSNFVESDGEGHKAPLVLVKCRDCTLVQLQHTVPAEWHYERGYWYRSGTNEQMVKQLRDVVDVAQAQVKLFPRDVVVDIGANDGTMLRMFPEQTKRIGFEPAKNLLTLAMEGGNDIYAEFFPPGNLSPLSSVHGKAKIICAIAMFYDLDDPNRFVRAVKSWLHADGVFITQMAYTPAMTRTNDIGNVSHEHLCYYDVKSFSYLLQKHGLKIAKVDFNEVNGGSFRCFIRHGKDGIAEDPGEIDWTAFARRVDHNKKATLQMLRSRTAKQETVAGIGASTRNNSLLQFYGIGPDLIEYFAERDPTKHGKRTVGTNIPIVSEEEMRRRKPQWLFVGPWHLLDSLIQRESGLRQTGTQFIVPLPQPRVV